MECFVNASSMICKCVLRSVLSFFTVEQTRIYVNFSYERLRYSRTRYYSVHHERFVFFFVLQLRTKCSYMRTIRLFNNKGLTGIKHVSGHHLIIEGLKLDSPFFSTIYGFQKSIKFIISVLNKAINKDVKVQHSKKEGWCVGVLFIGMLERSVLICDTTQFVKGDHN